LNGINTQGENIADNGGVKESYIAYRRWVEKHGPEPKLPGLDYTPEQMFWVAAGQTWCAKYRKGKTKMPDKSYQLKRLGTLIQLRSFRILFELP